MTLLQFVQYGIVAYLILVALAVTVILVWTAACTYTFRKNLSWQIAASQMLLDDELNIELSEFDRHVATTPGMIDNTND